MDSLPTSAVERRLLSSILTGVRGDTGHTVVVSNNETRLEL
jgi:hypothetical protein